METKKFMVINSADGQSEEILGKYMYYSLPHLIVKADKVKDICSQIGFPVRVNEKISLIDAFKSATGVIRDRIEERSGRERFTRLIYCRDNKRVNEGAVSRELVEETLNETTNTYRKLANFTLDRDCGKLILSDVDYCSGRDIQGYFDRAQGLFELYKDCIGSRSIETMADKYIAGMHATSISARGHHYFVPKAHMGKIDLLEDFMEAVAHENLFAYSDGRDAKYISINAMYVADDEKQRKKMAKEFYIDIGNRIQEYQKRMEHLIRSGNTSQKILDRWETKIQSLSATKHEYESILKQDLSGMDEQLSLLREMCDQFKLRVRSSQIFGAVA